MASSRATSNRWRLTLAFLLVAGVLTSAPNAIAAADQPASIFCVGEGLSDASYFVENSVVDVDGSLLVVGTINNGPTQTGATSAFVAKYASNGDLDFAFGTRGVVRLGFGGTSHVAYGIAVDGSGRLVISGTRIRAGAAGGFVARLLATGALDPTFGTFGVALLPGNPVTTLAVAASGRILVAGSDLVALDDAGRVDLAFGSAGSAGLGQVSRILVQPSGRIATISGGASVHVVGLTANGVLDPTFGTSGSSDRTLTTDHHVTDVAIAPDGTMAIAGEHRIDGATFHGFVFRMLPDGVWDPAFTNALGWDTRNEGAASVTIAPDHSMAVVTSGFIGVAPSLARLTPDGALDDGFGDGGVIEGDGDPASLRMRSDGTLVLAVNDQPQQGAYVAGFDATGSCVDPLANSPATISSYHALAPARLLDTRVGLGRAGQDPVPAGGSVDLVVAGRGGVPSDGVSAVVLNVTATAATAAGYVTVWPTGVVRPTASSLNVERVGETIASLVTVPVGVNGDVSLFTQSGGHLVADVMGYYGPTGLTRAGRLTTIEPQRVVDTRSGLGVGGTTTRPGANETLSVRMTGVDRSVPTTASAVVLNVTATEAAGPGYVTVWPGGDRPATSNLNSAIGGQTIANQVIVPIGAGGTIQLYTQTGTHLIVDVVGWFTGPDDVRNGSGLLVATSPTRNLDTRSATAPGAMASVSVDVAGRNSIPPVGVAAAVGTLTVTEAAGPGYVVAYPDDHGVPLASNLNVELAGQTLANHVITRLAQGRFQVLTQSGGHILVDITGWYTS